MECSTLTYKRWTIRRRMAIVAFASGLLYPVLLAFAPAESVSQVADVAMPFYTFVTFIVSLYATAVTWEDNKLREQSVGKQDDIG